MIVDKGPVPGETGGGAFGAALLGRLAMEPGRTVIQRGEKQISAGDLLAEARAIAGWLRDELPPGVPSPRVGLALHDNVTSIAAGLACWLVKATPLFIDHRIASASLPEWVARGELALLVTRQSRLDGIAPQVRLLPKQLGPADAADGGGLTSEEREAVSDGDAFADVFVSSGVSGFPKLTPVSHASLLRGVNGSASDGARGAWGAALSAVSVAFGASRLIWWRNLLFGKTIHAMDLLFSVVELDRALRNPGVEECTLPPNLIRALVQHARTAGEPTPRYPHLIKLQSVGGPALPQDKLAAQQLLSARYLMTYSSTETGVIGAIAGDDLTARPESVGRPVSGHQVEIVDADDVVLANGLIGRIRVTWTMRTADGEEERTAFPGDFGWLDDEGFLFISGRGDGIASRNGVNFSLPQLERRLLDSNVVADVAVLRVERAEGDDGLIVAVAPGAGAEVAEIGRELRLRLAPHEKPEAIILVQDDCISPGGKLLREAIVARFRMAPESFAAL